MLSRRARCAAIAGALAALALTSLPACTPAAIVGPSLLRLRGGSSPYRGGLWGSPSEPKVTVDELRKNMHSLLEKHASGVMGRDLRRLFKEVRAVASAMPSTSLSRAASECMSVDQSACMGVGAPFCARHRRRVRVRGVGCCCISLRASGLTKVDAHESMRRSMAKNFPSTTLVSSAPSSW
jgi:hypothetical protein